MKTLTGLQATKHILDPIHGPIPLTELEVKIISTPVFQRLRGITQLSQASLVFPGATHNRFQHCLGTLQVMDKYLYTLKLEDELLSDKVIQKMRIAALLHDVGHLPFSHTFENLIQIKHAHEEFGKIIVEKSDIKDILAKEQIEPETIGGLLTGNVSLKDDDDDDRILTILLPLLDSDADADRMDYLLRDAYYTGVIYGNVDINRISNFITIHEEQICFNEKSQAALEDFLFSRYQMYKIVYVHKTVICYELILHKIYENYIKKYSKDISLPFILPTIEEYESADKDWFNNWLCSLTEANFFNSIKQLLNQDAVTSKDKNELLNLYNCFKYRRPIKNCFHYDDLAEITKTEICEKESIIIKELNKNPDIINHWSFLRHDPSNPIRIAKPISKDADFDPQASEQIKIINTEGDISLLQLKGNSIISNLVGHHWALVCYYHEDERSQQIIRELAEKHIESKK